MTDPFFLTPFLHATENVRKILDTTRLVPFPEDADLTDYGGEGNFRDCAAAGSGRWRRGLVACRRGSQNSFYFLILNHIP